MKFHGLTDEQVKKSREENGSNAIPEPKAVTFFSAFLENFKDPMIKVLLVIAILMIVMFFMGYAEIYEPAGTILAVLIVALVSAKTSVASDSKYRELRQSTKKETCKVYRNGVVTIINVDDVVCGDKVLLQSGNKIPADGIMIYGKLSVDNSSLNGETEECYKTAAEENFAFPDKITGDTFVDEHSLFRGTVVIDGQGVLDVRKVGLQTMMGKMADEMQDDEVDSPLKVKLSKLAGQISKFGYIGSGAIAICYFLLSIYSEGGFSSFFSQGFETVFKQIVECISLAVVIIVCAVPEGLPLMISIVLMQNTSKMLDHNVLVRKAEGIETAGSLNILFSDKTGTITKGELEVVDFFTADGNSISLDKLREHDKIRELVDIAIGKNSLSMYDANHKVIGGNPTDIALMKFIGEETYLSLKANKNYIVDKTQGFNSTNKFSQSHIKSLGKTFYKGAPEKLLKNGGKYLDADGNLKIIDSDRLNAKINALAEKQIRVLCFGYSQKDLAEDSINDDIVVIGLVGIRDEVRQEAKEAIAKVKKAGIQVVMITGDRLETAKAIAKDTGLLTEESDVALSSRQLNEMSDEQVKKIIPNIRVIARALPTDKSRMVRLCQELNLVVGMTGDGVNDAPALKKADVGFAMGSGTEAAKEAGKIVVLDDNFRSIKDAIWYGRTIYHNILKFCKFQLVINMVAVIVSAIAPFFGVSEPLKVTHLLFVNLVMDGLGALMLGNEPALAQYMDEKPRRRDEGIISKSMGIQILVMALWLTILSFVFLKVPFFLNIFGSTEKLKTGYFVFFIAAALFNGFNVRDDGYSIFKRLKENPNFIKIMMLIMAIQAIIVNSALVPLGFFTSVGKMFSCTPFALKGWIVVYLLAATVIPVDLIRKAVIKSVYKQ